MSGKGKAQLKSPQKQPSKASMKKGAQSITITEMFKKQSDRKLRQSDSGSNVIDIDDDDIIFVGGSTASPYFNKTLSSVKDNVIKKSTECAMETPVSQRLRKRKLSLAKMDIILNCKSVTFNEQSENKLMFGDKDEKVVTEDNKFKRPISDKLTKSEKQNIVIQAKPLSVETAVTDHEWQDEEVPFVKSIKLNSRTSITNYENLNLDTINLNSGSSSLCTAGINSANETSLDISYSPVFSNQPDVIPIKCTVNIDTNNKCKIDSEQSNSGIHAAKQISGVDDKRDKDIPAADGDSDNGESKVSESKFKVPYYLNSFETLLQTVMEDETNRKLFNDDDMRSISTYQQLSDAAKKLFIRMFSRKLHWIPLNKLKYSEIADDLKPYLQELTEVAFIDCDEQLTDLEQVLNALSASDIKTLAKSYHIASTISQKRQLVQELLKKSQQSTLTTMFGYAGGDVARGMLTRAKKYLNGIYRLRAEPRGVFVRAMMLFSLVNTLVDEDSGTGGQGQLFQMLMVNMGKLVYPTYTIEKVHSVFRDREDLIRFEKALQLESDLLHCIDRGNWDIAYTVYQSIDKEWKLLASNEIIETWNRSLPDFLRCFTATSVIHRLLSASIDILQRRKDYSDAVELLHKLLSENTYNYSHRGYFWERLALNFDAHLKQPLESLEAVQSGLADIHVSVGHRLALYLRAESICKRLKLQHRLQEFHHEIVRETPKVYLEGRVLHQGVSTNGTRFLTEESYINGNSQDMTVVGVEEYVLGYYKRNGFPSGIHAEGSIVSTLFSLFFWDIMFMPVPDAFHSPFQSLPLDMHTRMFYDRRRNVIEERLAKLKNSSVQELQAHAQETWTSQQGVVCAGINWDRVSFDCINELLYCMGGEVLCGLIGRYARCPRHTRSGFPDLTLWNAETGALKICEVKGPGDRLSHKQILWIDYLLSLGVDAEVCHVKAVAAKKLRPSQQ